MKRNNYLKYLLLTFFTGINLLLFAQIEGLKNQLVTDCPSSMMQADNWYFGNYAGIKFNGNSPVALTDNNVMKVLKSAAVISDSLGNLLFFTDGMTVWDRSFQKMPNGTGLSGNPGATMPCVIVPIPYDDHRYYIFTVDMVLPPPLGTKGFCYSIVDMNLRNGMGDVTDIMNVQLLPEVSEKVTAVRHKNGKDVWVIAHKWNSNEFYAYLVTPTGIQNPVVSAIGLTHSGTIQENHGVGFMKLSSDGTKLALAISGEDEFEIFDFDNNTGVISNAITSAQTYKSAYGIEFSADCSKFFVTTMDITNLLPSFPSKLYQLDLKAGDATAVLNSATLIAVDTNYRMGGLQLGTDGKIYVSRNVNQFTAYDSLGVIQNPDRPGASCNYNNIGGSLGHGFYLNGKQSQFGLPAFMQSFVDIPAFTYDSCCLGDLTTLRITNTTNIDNVSWDFGDPASGSNASNALSPSHVFSAPGVYTVSLTETYNGEDYTFQEKVTIHALPPVDLGEDISLFSGSTATLSAPEGYDEYLWSTGATSSSITVDSKGTYWVRVKDNKCCINTDTIEVSIYNYYVPNAFTPDGDGTNDVFKAVGGLSIGIQFRMYIYNRWGQLVFSSDNILNGWDGKLNGSYCSSDVYAWVIYISFSSESIIQRDDFVMRGTVTLLR